MLIRLFLVFSGLTLTSQLSAAEDKTMPLHRGLIHHQSIEPIRVANVSSVSTASVPTVRSHHGFDRDTRSI